MTLGKNVTSTRGCGRSYDIQMEGNGVTLRRNQSHLKPRSFDLPLGHNVYLQQNLVLSEILSINNLCNLVLFGVQQTKMVPNEAEI